MRRQSPAVWASTITGFRSKERSRSLRRMLESSMRRSPQGTLSQPMSGLSDYSEHLVHGAQLTAVRSCSREVTLDRLQAGEQHRFVRYICAGELQ
jgi:hypothetical protein